MLENRNQLKWKENIQNVINSVYLNKKIIIKKCKKGDKKIFCWSKDVKDMLHFAVKNITLLLTGHKTQLKKILVHELC